MDVTVRKGEWCPELDLMPNGTVTVTFVDEDLDEVEVVVTSLTGRARWTCDNTTPSEDAGWYIPRDGTDVRQPPTSGATVVKLWSSDAGTACVQRGG